MLLYVEKLAIFIVIYTRKYKYFHIEGFIYLCYREEWQDPAPVEVQLQARRDRQE